MSGALVRVVAMALKELKVVLLDRRVLTTLVISPVVQLILFGFATTLEVKNFPECLLGDDRAVRRTYVMGQCAWDRDGVRKAA